MRWHRYNQGLNHKMRLSSYEYLQDFSQKKTEESQLDFFLKFKKEVAHHLILNWINKQIHLHPWQTTKMMRKKKKNPSKRGYSHENEQFHWSTVKTTSNAWTIKHTIKQNPLGVQLELLQQLPEVGGLGQLSADSGHLVKDRTVQWHTGDQPLRAATAVPTDLNTNTHQSCYSKMNMCLKFI